MSEHAGPATTPIDVLITRCLTEDVLIAKLNHMFKNKKNYTIYVGNKFLPESSCSIIHIEVKHIIKTVLILLSVN